VRSEDDSGNSVLIATFSCIVPGLALMALLLIYCNKRRRKQEQLRADFEAQMENELNAVQSINKSKQLDDHMIVNSLDFPRKQNTNPNIADEELFSAKDSAYKQMSRTKQLNTDTAAHRASLYCDKPKTKANNLDISSSTLNSSYSEKSSLKKEQNRDREPLYSGLNSCGSSSPVYSSNSDDHCGANQKCLPDDLFATEV